MTTDEYLRNQVITCPICDCYVVRRQVTPPVLTSRYYYEFICSNTECLFDLVIWDKMSDIKTIVKLLNNRSIAADVVIDVKIPNSHNYEI